MDNAVRSGDLGWCRVIATDGRAVADLDVSLKDGHRTVRFNTPGIRKGGPVSVYGPCWISGALTRSPKTKKKRPL